MLQTTMKTEINNENIQEHLNEMVDSHRHFCDQGEVADYIPELGKANRHHLAASVCLLSGEIIEAGDTDVLFTMQSISKVVSLALALKDNGEQVVFDKVGMEPTGDPFNSIVKLETMNPNRPLNPMINAGAIAVTSLIKGTSNDEKIGRLLQFVHELTGRNDIKVNEKVAQSENETANLNRALTYFMKEHDVIQDNIEDVLDVYFKQCAIEVNTSDIARIGAILAHDGRDLENGTQLIPRQIAKICKTFMVTCGMYNASGEFAIKVGIPAKSGVAGGIMGAIPKELGIGIYSPALDERGNSVAGIEMLSTMSKRWNFSIF